MHDLQKSPVILELFRAGKLVGDALLAAAFVSYAGPFTIPFRNSLVQERWLPDLVSSERLCKDASLQEQSCTCLAAEACSCGLHRQQVVSWA